MIRKIIVTILVTNVLFPCSLINADQQIIINNDLPNNEVVVLEPIKQPQLSLEQQIDLLNKKIDNLENNHKDTAFGKFSIFSLVAGTCIITGTIVSGSIMNSIINKLKIETVHNEKYGNLEPKITFNK